MIFLRIRKFWMLCKRALVYTCKVFPILEMEDTMMPSGFMIVWQDLELSWRMLQMVTVDSPASFWWLETETPPEAGSKTLALPRHFRILKPISSTDQSILITLLVPIFMFLLSLLSRVIFHYNQLVLLKVGWCKLQTERLVLIEMIMSRWLKLFGQFIW